MKLDVSDKSKKDTFVSIFQVLKSCTSILHIMFNADALYIQGMDKAHVCLFEIQLKSSWFQEYEAPGPGELASVSVDSAIFYNVLSMNQDQHSICICYGVEDEGEKIHINLLGKNGKGEYDKFFTIPLADSEHALLDIPSVDYDAEFTIHCKKIGDIISQLLIFGDVMNVQCSEEKISIFSKGVSGEMLVNIPIDDLGEFSISEGEIIKVCYSLQYLSKMCITTKLSSDIEFGISPDFPMRIRYDLGEDNGCYMAFYIAPKIED